MQRYKEKERTTIMREKATINYYISSKHRRGGKNKEKKNLSDKVGQNVMLSDV